MIIKKYDKLIGRFRKETKEEIMQKEDIEGKHPCEKCWKKARRGIYVWPAQNPNLLKRCKCCGRVIG